MTTQGSNFIFEEAEDSFPIPLPHFSFVYRANSLILSSVTHFSFPSTLLFPYPTPLPYLSNPPFVFFMPYSWMPTRVWGALLKAPIVPVLNVLTCTGMYPSSPFLGLFLFTLSLRPSFLPSSAFLGYFWYLADGLWNAGLGKTWPPNGFFYFRLPKRPTEY